MAKSEQQEIKQTTKMIIKYEVYDINITLRIPVRNHFTFMKCSQPHTEAFQFSN